MNVVKRMTCSTSKVILNTFIWQNFTNSNYMYGTSYSEIVNDNSKCAFWTFKSQSASKIPAHCRISIVTVRNKVANVMFLHLSVILFTGGFCLSACWDTTPSPTMKHTPPPEKQTNPSSPGSTAPPGSTLPGRRLPLWTVRILLECILVLKMSLYCPFRDKYVI